MCYRKKRFYFLLLVPLETGETKRLSKLGGNLNKCLCVFWRDGILAPYLCRAVKSCHTRAILQSSRTLTATANIRAVTSKIAQPAYVIAPVTAPDCSLLSRDTSHPVAATASQPTTSRARPANCGTAHWHARCTLS